MDQIEAQEDAGHMMDTFMEAIREAARSAPLSMAQVAYSFGLLVGEAAVGLRNRGIPQAETEPEFLEAFTEGMQHNHTCDQCGGRIPTTH